MSRNDRKWKPLKDPLYRGDIRDAPSTPSPRADRSVVRHVLYLGGAGRESPYLSLTEDEIVALRFAGNDGKVYSTHVKILKDRDVGHIPRRELLQLLRGTGKGRACWSSAWEVQRARQYVEENAEHLADFSGHDNMTEEELRALVTDVLK